MEIPIVIIGGGPAGAAAGRLLASWGHRTVLLNRRDAPEARSRGLAESLPPSTRKVLAQIGLLEMVERAGFYRSTGNTVWWGSTVSRIESFGQDQAPGFQVYRPNFDRLLLEAAQSAGVDVRAGALVRNVAFAGEAAQVTYEHGGQSHTLACRRVLDCSGRTGIVARQFRRLGTRTYALVGRWHNTGDWRLPDPTHTVVEAYDGGWTWSVPTTAALRQIGTMTDGQSARHAGARTLASAYLAELARSPAMADTVRGAELQDVWACDATTYSSDMYAGPQHLLVGDAGSFVDPLSSFGVKKALASAWVAATVINTCMTRPELEPRALEFFTAGERELYAQHATQSRAFAREAAARYPHPFWIERASAAVDEPARQPLDLCRPSEVQAALREIQSREDVELMLDERVTFEKQPVIRGREIVLEDALALAVGGSSGGPSTHPVRFVDNVDLVALARLAGRRRLVPDLMEAYSRTIGPAPLPKILGGLSLLVAAGVLRQRNNLRC